MSEEFKQKWDFELNNEHNFNVNSDLKNHPRNMLHTIVQSSIAEYKNGERIETNNSKKQSIYMKQDLDYISKKVEKHTPITFTDETYTESVKIYNEIVHVSIKEKNDCYKVTISVEKIDDDKIIY